MIHQHNLPPSAWGWFAAVFYIPDPQRSCIESLRKSIPGKPLSQVHITLLPPRPLAFPAEQACASVRSGMGGQMAFQVRLAEVRLFAETNFLYLDIAEGSCNLYHLHHGLNAGQLRYTEAFEFRPHVTIGGPVPESGREAAQRRVETEWQSASCPRHFLIDEMVCLWLPPGSEPRQWIRLQSYALKRDHQRVAAGFRNQTC